MSDGWPRLGEGGHVAISDEMMGELCVQHRHAEVAGYFITFGDGQ